MKEFVFSHPTKVYFGEGAAEKALKTELAHAGDTVMLAYGGGSVKKNGIYGEISGILRALGKRVVDFSGIMPNPTYAKVQEGAALARKEQVDTILAVGGGSVIDTAKAIAAGALYDGDFWDFYCGRAEIRRALPVGVVLTIPAAGSEGSGNSVITRLSDRRKISLRTDFWLRPKFAVMNPELTFTLPRAQTAAGIADMMAHIMERYFTTTPDVQTTDRVAEGVLMAIVEEAPKVMARPDDYEARANIMWAGTLAHNGICGCGRREDWASHGLEHELSALYGVTHGTGLAVVFPAWMEFMAGVRPAKIAQLGRRVFGVEIRDDRAAALEAVARLRTFFVSLGLPKDLKGLGIPDPDIDTLVARFHENKGNPAGAYWPLTPADTRAIYLGMTKI